MEPQSSAEKAGLQEGDILLSIGNKKIDSADDYESVAKSLAAGDTMQTELWRNGQKETLAVKTEVFPPELAESLAFRLLGIEVEDLTPANRRSYRISAQAGVMITRVKPKSYLARIGAEAGDIIRQIDDYTIQNREDFKKAVVKFRQKNSVVLLLQRGDQGYYITVNLG